MRRIVGALVLGSLSLHCGKWPDPAHNDDAVSGIIANQECQLVSQYTGDQGTMCSEYCTDLKLDPMNCGSCGDVCPSSAAACVDGVCCDEASGTCVDGGSPFPGDAAGYEPACDGTGELPQSCCGVSACPVASDICLQCEFGPRECAPAGTQCCNGTTCLAGETCTPCGCLRAGDTCCGQDVCASGSVCTDCGCLPPDLGSLCCGGTPCYEGSCQLCGGVATCVGPNGCAGFTLPLDCDGGLVPTLCQNGYDEIEDCLPPDAGCEF